MTQVPMTLTTGQSHRSRSNVEKLAKIYKIGHISDAISPTDFILGTKVQPNKLHSMTQVPIIFKVKISTKWVKYLTTGHILDAISPTDFIIFIITAFCDSFGRCPLVLHLGLKTRRCLYFQNAFCYIYFFPFFCNFRLGPAAG